MLKQITAWDIPSPSRNHRQRRSWLQFVGLSCVCSLLMIGCGQPTSQSSNQTEADSNSITIGTTLKTRTVDPADAYEVISGNLLYNLGDRLYTYEPGTTTLKPQLATELPKISSDGLTYTIPLRQGVLFHDNTPFNAEAMAFSLRRFIENGGPPSSLLADTIDTVKATGEFELTIQLKKPFSAFPTLLAFSGACAVSPKVYEIGEGKFKPDTFVGTGPYKLAEYGTDFIKLEAFDQYWGEKPANPGVALQVFSSSANLFNAFRTGGIDVAYLSLDANQIKTLAEGATQQKWQMVQADGTTINYLVLNVKSEPLNQVEVRQALAAIINRPLINERVLQGQADPLYSLIPTSFSTYKPAFQERYGDANVTKAKELLTKAGYSVTNPAKIEIWYASGTPKRALVASTLKASVEKDLGGILQLELNTVEAATAFENLDKGIYPTFMLDWYSDFFDSDNYIQPFLACAKGSPATGCEQGASQYQGSFYYSDRINQLIDQERQEINPEKRQEIFSTIQEIVAEDVPFIPLWQDQDYVFAQTGIQGVRLEPTQQFPFSSLSEDSGTK